MSPEAVNGQAQPPQLAKAMTLFEIDEALSLLIESAYEHAAENDGLISEDLRNALAEYLGAFGEKVDRIANYIKAQEGVAELARKEANRLEARRKAAENRVKTVKAFLCWFMECRSLKHLKGRLNTITLANNSVESLVLDDGVQPPPTFQNVALAMTWGEWQDVQRSLPSGPLRERLTREAANTALIDRTRIDEALKAGQTVAGARLVRGRHVRIS